MTDNEWFEIKAAAFYAMTGFMAPGKDIPAAANPSESYLVTRAAEWDRWSLEYSDILPALREALEDRT